MNTKVKFRKKEYRDYLSQIRLKLNHHISKYLNQPLLTDTEVDNLYALNDLKVNFSRFTSDTVSKDEIQIYDNGKGIVQISERIFVALSNKTKGCNHSTKVLFII